MRRRSTRWPTTQLIGALVMCAIDCRQHRIPLAIGQLGLTSQSLCGASDRGLPPQVHRLGVNGVAQKALQRRAPPAANARI